MDAADFVRKWAASRGKERATSQEHFIDLCRLLGEQTPNEADPAGTFYAFERGARTLDGDGFADVWLDKHFAWEYKGKHKDLGVAYKQVQTYREALGNPPALVVCDLNRYQIHTNWTSTETWIYEFSNEDILSDRPVGVLTYSGVADDAPKLTALQVLKALFEDPERLKPHKTTEQITRKAAEMFGEISQWLRDWEVDDMEIARFVTRTMFCMFATDVGLLPPETFTEILTVHKKSGDDKSFRKHLANLFRVMRKGGNFSMYPVPYFNGSLFNDTNIPTEVTAQQIRILDDLNALNWAEVEPSIFGTLFERVIDPSQRKMLGAHYTSRADIELIVKPVLMAPLEREWAEVRAEIERIIDRKRLGEAERRKRIGTELRRFQQRLATIRVLDPACGSGNFLYVSLALLKAMEKAVLAYAAVHGVSGMKPRVHPRQLYGIETSPYAHELSSIVIWIGYLQWKHRNAMPLDDEEPILDPLDQVRLMDAIVGVGKKGVLTEPQWPESDVIVGNPPFLGGKQLRKALGDDYVEKMFAVWDGRVARESDLCCYWLEKARGEIETGRAKRAGLLATQAIRGGANRRTLERIKQTGDVFYAQADRKWIQDGVAVRVSMVGFDNGAEHVRLLNTRIDDSPEQGLNHARPVDQIGSDLTSGDDLTLARRLKENLGISFMGDTKAGAFDIAERLARQFIATPNPHGRPNSDVVRPWVNGLDITRRPRSMWIIDFRPGTTPEEAAKYEGPFEYVKKAVRPFREKNNRVSYAQNWWLHAEPRPAMRKALGSLERYVATPNLTKYRFFVWLPRDVLPDHQLIVFARSDDYFFGVLHSRAHEVWALRQGTQLEDRPRYTPTSCFETFPFPKASAAQRAAIGDAAKELDDLRRGWLDPVTEALGFAPSELRKRTLTNLYNQRPTWLVDAHRTLDEAVFAAYGWRERPDELSDEEMLGRLLALNLEREPA